MAKASTSRKLKRRLKLTPKVIDAAFVAAQDGASTGGIARALEVYHGTVRQWMRKGELEDAEEPWRSFYQAVSAGWDEAENRCVKALLEAGTLGSRRVEVVRREGKPDMIREIHSEPDWRAATTYLERRHPERWSPKREVHLSGDVHQKHIILDGRDPFADLKGDPDGQADEAIAAAALDAAPKRRAIGAGAGKKKASKRRKKDG